MGHHAMIGPDRLAFNMPVAVKHFEGVGMSEAVLVERLSDPLGLGNGGCVGNQKTAGHERIGGVGYYTRSRFVHFDTGPVRSW